MSERDVHALLSPSSASRWMVCVGSAALCKGMSDESSEYADEGTAAHEVTKMALVEVKDAAAYIGRRIQVGPHKTVDVTDEMAEGVQVYVDAVRERVEHYKLAGATSVELLVEQRVPIGHITGEEGAEGTADVVIIVLWADGTALIDVWDLKFGQGVKVFAENNPQGMLYALGAVEKFSVVTDFNRVRINIHQPRVSEEPSDWEITIAQLHEFAFDAGCRAREALDIYNGVMGAGPVGLRAGEHCRETFCRARATCPALAGFVTESVGADFETLASAENLGHADPAVADGSTLRRKFESIGIIQDWCKAVRAKVEATLFESQNTPEIIEALGVKLVEGKLGNRSWVNEEDAKKMLREQFRLPIEQAFNLELKSPPQIEKLAPKFDKKGKVKPPKEGEPKPVLGEKQWTKLQALITRKPGQPSVAPASDPRPALVLTPASDDFETAVEGADLV